MFTHKACSWCLCTPLAILPFMQVPFPSGELDREGAKVARGEGGGHVLCLAPTVWLGTLEVKSGWCPRGNSYQVGGAFLEDTLQVSHTRDNSWEATTAAKLEAGEPGKSGQREAQSRVGGMGCRPCELYRSRTIPKYFFQYLPRCGEFWSMCFNETGFDLLKHVLPSPGYTRP